MQQFITSLAVAALALTFPFGTVFAQVTITQSQAVAYLDPCTALGVGCVTVCGNGIVESGEQCDDGKTCGTIEQWCSTDADCPSGDTCALRNDGCMNASGQCILDSISTCQLREDTHPGVADRSYCSVGIPSFSSSSSTSSTTSSSSSSVFSSSSSSSSSVPGSRGNRQDVNHTVAPTISSSSSSSSRQIIRTVTPSSTGQGGQSGGQPLPNSGMGTNMILILLTAAYPVTIGARRYILRASNELH